MASGLILLPLVLRPDILGGNELGMYWVFVELGGLAFLFDFGFSPSIGRNVSYAMAGAFGNPVAWDQTASQPDALSS